MSNYARRFTVDAVSIDQPAKFVAAALAGLSAMLQLPVPHVTVLSKSGALGGEAKLEAFLEEGRWCSSLGTRTRSEMKKDGRRIAVMIDCMTRSVPCWTTTRCFPMYPSRSRTRTRRPTSSPSATT